MLRRRLFETVIATYGLLSAADKLKMSLSSALVPAIVIPPSQDPFTEWRKAVSSSPLITVLEGYKTQLEQEAGLNVVLGFRPLKDSIEYQLRWGLEDSRERNVIKAAAVNKQGLWLLGDPTVRPRIWVDDKHLNLESGVLPWILKIPLCLPLSAFTNQGLLTKPLR